MNNIVIDNITLPTSDTKEEVEIIQTSAPDEIINLNDLENSSDLYELISGEKKSSYTEAGKRAQQKYREKYPDKYCEAQRKLYERKKEDPDWKEKFNERSRINNQIYRDRKAKELLDAGIAPKKRGRPRKIKPEDV